ncbi:MAG: substrate-binding domain-containing protein [Sphingomonadaceae bacterium]
MKTRSITAAAAALFFAACDGGGSGGDVAGQPLQIVGSSTVYPFTKAVAERFAQTHPSFPSPIVESTGTGAGFKQFCQGVGGDHPDIANASRRITRSEIENCGEAGVDEVIEIQIGIDGIAFATSPETAEFELTERQIYEALAARPYGEEQTAEKWSDIDASLPDIPIIVYGPPPTSGTRDALAELVLEDGCKSNPQIAALEESNEDEYKEICTRIREDGTYIESGENDNLIAQKVIVNQGAVGVFGYSFLAENENRLRGIAIDGVEPTYDAISSYEYGAARPLFIYVKGAHVGVIPGLREFVEEYSRATGPGSYLVRRGLVPAREEVRARSAQAAANFTPLDPAEIE